MFSLDEEALAQPQTQAKWRWENVNRSEDASTTDSTLDTMSRDWSLCATTTVLGERIGKFKFYVGNVLDMWDFCERSCGLFYFAWYFSYRTEDRESRSSLDFFFVRIIRNVLYYLKLNLLWLISLHTTHKNIKNIATEKLHRQHASMISHNWKDKANFFPQETLLLSW